MNGRGTATAFALVAFAALHVAWGCGSTFPFPSREEFNDAVIGRQASASPSSCFAVAAALSGAAASVRLAGHGRGGSLPRLAATGVAGVLATRAAFGLAGRTDRLVPGSSSPRFKALDRSRYSPLCLVLAAGAARAAASSPP